MIFPDLPSPAEAFIHTIGLCQGFAQAGNRCPLFGIMLYAAGNGTVVELVVSPFGRSSTSARPSAM
jgi:hypothetical protein